MAEGGQLVTQAEMGGPHGWDLAGVPAPRHRPKDGEAKKRVHYQVRDTESGTRRLFTVFGCPPVYHTVCYYYTGVYYP